ncbi:MAG: cobalt ECF transporter T component CbiQ [Nitriliruptor sp.]
MGAGHAHALYVHEHSPVHRLAPHVKIVAAFVFVFAVAVTPREAVWAFGIDLVAIATVIRIARVPYRFVLLRMAVILPFLVAALLLPLVASGPQVVVFGVGLATEGLWGAWNVVAKAGIGSATSITLAATTEVPRLLRGLDRLRVPPVLTQIATFMVRYLEVVAGELSRQRTAMVARGHDPRWLWQVRPIAASLGTVFVRSYERGERVHAAMLARGYERTMPVLEPVVRVEADWWRASLLPALGVTLAVVALVVTP